MFVEALQKQKDGKIIIAEAENLFDYYTRESDDDVWTDKKEFH